MPLVLHIETATNVCSVALAGDRQLLSLRESTFKNSHAAVITQFIDEVTKSSNLELSSIDAIAVSKGPGSYTGLRIGVATAKGLCYALDKPLIAIPTLQAMASGLRPQASGLRPQASGIWPQASGIRRLASGIRESVVSSQQSAVGSQQSAVKVLFCPMIDARRMEVYYALYDLNGNEIRETRAEIIDENSFSDLLVDHMIIFGGDGSQKCREFLKSQENAVFIDDFEASAQFMIGLAEEKFQRKEFEDLAYFEPYYLKDFIAAKARVKGLN
jgi:tRNA threonylcarbamoyladenosine biosynthesis protein TsaB